MKLSKRCALFSISMLSVLCFAASSFGQAKDPEAAAAVTSGKPGYTSKAPVNAGSVAGIPIADSSLTFDAVTGAVISGGLQGNANANTNVPAQTGNDDILGGDRRPNRQIGRASCRERV